MRNKWFESVAVAQSRAKTILPSPIYDALMAGSERGQTRDENAAAFEEVRLAPVVADKAAEQDLSTTVMGQPISFPVIVSPTGVQAVHPEGEVAVARATASRGTAMGLSAFASKPLEEVVAANPQTMMQLYWIGGRDKVAARVERARAAGAVGLIITLDWSFTYGRDWGSPTIPSRIDASAVRRYAPRVATKPRWLLQWLRHRSLPSLTVPNMVERGEVAPPFFDAYDAWSHTAPPTWDDIAWLRSQWDGPFMVKGIVRIDDALRARDAGATAISVSNHGGNNIDGTPPTIRVLPGIAEAVGGDLEVILDGGIRRGSDVVKSLALGARAVMIGRAALWGLAAGGEAGVANVLDVLRDGTAAVLLSTGKRSIDDLEPSDVVLGPEFAQRLGVGPDPSP